MRLGPLSTEKSYVSVKALMEDVNKTASRQSYKVLMKEGNKKDKNDDLCKVRLDCTKGGEYRENVEEAGEVSQERQQRRQQRTGCPFKAYASRKDYEWYLRVDAQSIIILPSHPKLLLQIGNSHKPIL